MSRVRDLYLTICEITASRRDSRTRKLREANRYAPRVQTPRDTCLTILPIFHLPVLHSRGGTPIIRITRIGKSEIIRLLSIVETTFERRKERERLARY